MDPEKKKQLEEIINSVTRNIQKSSNANAVFGEAVEKGDVTVIPVARLSICGFGGGGKGDRKDPSEKDQKGSGLGMGIKAKTIPVGYIKISNNEVTYAEVTDTIRMMLSGMALGAFAIFSLTRLIKKLLK